MSFDQQYSQSQPSRGILYRLVQAVSGLLILICLACGYLGLRAIVWRHDADLVAMLSSGLTIALILGIPLSILYLLLGERGLRLVLRFHWMNIQLGLVLGMLLYGIYKVLVVPIPEIGESDIILRGLQGAVDGALIGTFVGGLIGIVSQQPVQLTRSGLARFTILFALILLGLSIIILMGNQPGLPRNLAVWLLIPMILILRIATGIYDRRRHGKNAALPETHYDADEYVDYDG
jgi:hypothetical protein